MKKINSFIVVGGDSRQLYMAEYLNSLGYKIQIYGLPEKNLKCVTNIKDAISESDGIIFPLPVTRDNKYIFSIVPMKETADDIFSMINRNQPIFAGMITKSFDVRLRKKSEFVYDYFKREDVTVMNTVPTVQGILKVIIDNIDYTVHSSKCAVFGYGRVAKLTAEILDSLGAEITVVARKSGDIATAKTKGLNSVFISDFKNCADEFDIIVNTVPSLVIDRNILEKLKKDCLIIDVASAPFGTDFAVAYELGLKALQSSSLPGKVAPKTAGKIIADGIINIIKEGEYE